MSNENDQHPDWPEWAAQCLKIIRKTGAPIIEDEDGVDLPVELEVLIEEYEIEILRLKREIASLNGEAARRAKAHNAESTGQSLECFIGEPTNVTHLAEEILFDEPNAPVCWAYEYETTEGWVPGYMGVRPSAHPSRRNIRPLYDVEAIRGPRR
jgi:hypothetical protein